MEYNARQLDTRSPGAGTDEFYDQDHLYRQHHPHGTAAPSNLNEDTTVGHISDLRQAESPDYYGDSPRGYAFQDPFEREKRHLFIYIKSNDMVNLRELLTDLAHIDQLYYNDQSSQFQG